MRTLETQPTSTLLVNPFTLSIVYDENQEAKETQIYHFKNFNENSVFYTHGKNLEKAKTAWQDLHSGNGLVIMRTRSNLIPADPYLLILGIAGDIKTVNYVRRDREDLNCSPVCEELIFLKK